MLASEMQANIRFCGSRVLSYSLNNEFVDFYETLSPNDVDVSCSYVSVDKKDDYTVAIIRLHVEAHCKSANNSIEDASKLDTDLLIEGCFIVSNKLCDEDLMRYVIINGSAVLYSMARSFISSVTSLSMTNGKLTLPMISTFSLYEQYLQDKEANSKKQNT